MAQRHALQNFSQIVCHSTQQDTEGFRSGTATSWAVELNRNIVIAVDASEVRLALESCLRNQLFCRVALLFETKDSD
jgi:hypothetical protein